MSYSPSIIKTIIHIDFPLLRILNLCTATLNLAINEIVSIEPLVGIKAPILEVLKLCTPILIKQKIELPPLSLFVK